MSLALSNRDGGKTSERGLYDSIGAHLSGEVISGFRVRQADPVSMNVRVGGEYNSTTGSGKDSILIRDGLRTYDVFIDDGVAVTATVSAAHASLARIDTVVVYVDKSVARTKTLVDNTNGVVKVKVVSGTPNASPVAPDDTAIQSSVGSGNPFAKLANIAVAANATNILDSHITDKRNYASVSNLSGVFSDYIVPGTGVIAVSSGLTCTISDITYYINGIRYTKTGISNKTFTASKDTYCFIDTAGTITYTEVANGADAPSLPANSIFIGWVEANGSAVTGIHLRNRGTEKVGLVKKADTSVTTQGATSGAAWNGLSSIKAHLVAGYRYKISFSAADVSTDGSGQHAAYLHVRDTNISGAILARSCISFYGSDTYRNGQFTGFGYFDATVTGSKTFFFAFSTSPASGFNIGFNSAGVVSVECVGLTSESA